MEMASGCVGPAGLRFPGAREQVAMSNENEFPFCELRLPDMEPERKSIVLLLAMAREDQAVEVEIHDGAIRWLEGGRWSDLPQLSGPGSASIEPVVASMTGHSGPMQFPWRGEIDCEVGDAGHLRWSVQIQRPGDTIRFSRPLLH